MGDEADAMWDAEMCAWGAEFELAVYRCKINRSRKERPIHFTKTKRSHPVSPRKAKP